MLKEFSYREIDSLLAAVGYGIITAGQLLAKLLTPDELKLYRPEKAPAPPASSDNGRPARDTRRTPSGNAVIVYGAAGYVYKDVDPPPPLEDLLAALTPPS